jgi:hypothetical protein
MSQPKPELGTLLGIVLLPPAIAGLVVAGAILAQLEK